jgi:hypothetical protein
MHLLSSAQTAALPGAAAWEAFILFCVAKARRQSTGFRLGADRVLIRGRELPSSMRADLLKAVETRNRNLLPFASFECE